MSGTLSVEGKNKILASLLPTKISLHNDVMPIVGDIKTEKVDIHFGAPDNGLIASLGNVIINVKAGTTVNHYALWDAEDVMVAYGELTSSQFFAQDGVYVIDAMSIDLNKGVA